MGLFKKKEKPVEEPPVPITGSTFGQEKKDTKSTKSSAKYKVIIKESLGKITRTVRTIKAERFIDEDDNVVYLRSVSDKFLEVFPEDEPQTIKLTDTELDKKLIELKALIKNPKERKDKDLNIHNLESDYRKYSAQKRSLKFGVDASYISFDEQGTPELYYLRKGSTFHPCKWDMDTSTIYTASDNKKKKSVISLRNKETKYQTKQLIATSTIIFMVVNVILAAVLIWGAAKNFSTYDESEIAAIKRACIENTLVAAQAIQSSAENVARITSTIEGKLNVPDVIIEGIVPK